MRKILVLLFLLIYLPALAQKRVNLESNKTLRFNGQVLSHGLSQGINSAQIQTLDLRGDGVEEWVSVLARKATFLEVEGSSPGIYFLQLLTQDNRVLVKKIWIR